VANLIGSTTEPNTAAVRGENTNDTNAAGVGVHGVSNAAGVLGESKTWHGVAGLSQSTTGGAGVFGKGLSGNFGVLGESTTGAGVEGRSQSGPGVFAQSDAVGVWGKSKTWHGVAGESQSTTTGGAGVYGKGVRAGLFEGNVDITGNLTIQGVSIQSLLQRINQLEQQGANVGQLVQRVSSLEQEVAALKSQLNTASSNLTARVTQAEVTISGLASLSHTHG
jgi:hypothetical protein